MSIEAVAAPSNTGAGANAANGNSGQSQAPNHVTKVEVAQFTPGGASSATPNDYRELGDVLLGDDMMGESWNHRNSNSAPSLTRSTSTFLPPTHPQTQQPHIARPHVQVSQPQAQSPSATFFASPPVQLTRHASLPVSMIRQHPMQMHQVPAFAMAAPPQMMAPPLARQRTHGFVMHASPHHAQNAFGMPRLVAFQHPGQMHMPVPHQMNTINLSVAHQQPTAPVNQKSEVKGDNVEPIAFTGMSDARMSLGEIDSIALAVLSEPSKDKDGKKIKDEDNEEDMNFKQSTASSIGCGQDLERALDSLDKFLPEADSDLFRPSDFRPSDLASMVAPQPPVHSQMITPRTTVMATGRNALPLIMSPHMKTVTSPAQAMAMMMGVVPHTPHSHAPRASPKPMATCKVGGCDRRVRSKGFCKTHGGGRKCSIEGCKKSSQNGEFCIGHGGGKKCKQEGCAKAAQSHGLCKAHGGGARCKYPNCNKSSQGGGLCRAHGGGKRCQAAGCPKGAQRGNFCATHGGFRNCKIDGCVRTDRGGGFCEVHRRGRLCKIDGCKKLARNQGMCTMHIREDKQDEEGLSPRSDMDCSPIGA